MKTLNEGVPVALTAEQTAVALRAIKEDNMIVNCSAAQIYVSYSRSRCDDELSVVAPLSCWSLNVERVDYSYYRTVFGGGER